MAHLHRRSQATPENKCCVSSSGWGAQEAGNVDETDLALAREMNELSVNEREQVFDEIHGVAKSEEETPDFIAQCLAKMDLSLSMIPKAKRKALDRALFFKPSIETDAEFKLMFLRTDDYDSHKAAIRMAKYFAEKLLIFGEEKLVKKITLDDLTEEDLKRLNFTGCIVLPNKDQVGRPIWFFDMARIELQDLESVYRCFWYQVMATVEDETAQIKGVCDVAYCPGDLLAIPSSMMETSQLFSRTGRMMEGLPCRVTTFQFCYNDKRVKYLLSVMAKAFGKHVRLRLRSHFGSDLEMQYSLMTFGIHCHYLFRSAENDGRMELLRSQYINGRRKMEQEEHQERLEVESRSGIILHPQPYDVLVGRGRPYQEYPGNQRLVRLVEAQSERYRFLQDRFEKSCIILNIVKTVNNSNGRFLQKCSEGWWTVAPAKVAREKTCSAFRSIVGKANMKDDTLKHSAPSDSDASSPKRLKRVQDNPSGQVV
mmetsp:Transcript_23993/g.36455  ORF Transcript_23993/g.36455 Transcript_23993/m.36455 type:complete len:483 (-) Transcript_23993:124-1572(-)|eukprot:CAMPEP_0117025716 /NCGR_PEP_ID=MMETSP0472-20121206/18973_1 /TAXON_ID=693140 ORGANISM="Tiarina fusus, Strain LIS" /NCGR_SAMPLE_ID=MMETSP0472 /ASSEMBLY_ACC=CAM_ASM_000603 /LENGTH=482 /DNA_ID=CAMNT_0004732517 /DNA_START=63 /DNA_END=1511 /DNA_ORIENTATION=-